MPKSIAKHHDFTPIIEEILRQHFGEDSQAVLDGSPLLGYLNVKTRSATRGSKARGSFANLYALYVIIGDYINTGHYGGQNHGRYSEYEGARFSDLFLAQRTLPFGSKLQNHGLNSRMNEEFKRYYPTSEKLPIIRNLESQRYWIHEDFLNVVVRTASGQNAVYNIAPAVIEIIDAYAKVKLEAFEAFIATCKEIAELAEKDSPKAAAFIESQLQPNVDARVFEIVSYAVLKAKYGNETIWIGDTREDVAEEALILYKTGRTNANDGGIDFVMKPKGRFFQVTETIDMGKYFLDIDKVQRYPITFVVKSAQSAEEVLAAIREQATTRYRITSVIEKYMSAIEEVITTPQLLEIFRNIVAVGGLPLVMAEVIIQGKVEFNYKETDSDEPSF